MSVLPPPPLDSPGTIVINQKLIIIIAIGVGGVLVVVILSVLLLLSIFCIWKARKRPRELFDDSVDAVPLREGFSNSCYRKIDPEESDGIYATVGDCVEEDNRTTKERLYDFIGKGASDTETPREALYDIVAKDEHGESLTSEPNTAAGASGDDATAYKRPARRLNRYVKVDYAPDTHQFSLQDRPGSMHRQQQDGCTSVAARESELSISLPPATMDPIEGRRSIVRDHLESADQGEQELKAAEMALIPQVAGDIGQKASAGTVPGQTESEMFVFTKPGLYDVPYYPPEKTGVRGSAKKATGASTSRDTSLQCQQQTKEDLSDQSEVERTEADGCVATPTSVEGTPLSSVMDTNDGESGCRCANGVAATAVSGEEVTHREDHATDASVTTARKDSTSRATADQGRAAAVTLTSSAEDSPETANHPRGERDTACLRDGDGGVASKDITAGIVQETNGPIGSKMDLESRAK